MTGYYLDLRKLLCPMPVIKTQDRISQLQTGDVLKVRCSDPGALHDIPAWCRINGHKLISTATEGDEYVVIVEVVAAG